MHLSPARQALIIATSFATGTLAGVATQRSPWSLVTVILALCAALFAWWLCLKMTAPILLPRRCTGCGTDLMHSAGENQWYNFWECEHMHTFKTRK